MRRKRDIIIELTSLLDVIMIMIFMVMTENSKLITEKQDSLDKETGKNAELSSSLDDTRQKLDDTQRQLAEAQGKLGEGSLEELLDRLLKAESKLESYKYMDEVVTVINIGLENRYGNSMRVLTFGTVYDSQNSDEQIFEIRTNEELYAAVNSMRVFVHEHISKVNTTNDSAIVYMVFTYNPSKVYQDDYSAVDEALNQAEIRAGSGNVRYRINRISI